jgi:protein-S-isoprenylcysteine O-methyltransferase Ste14
MLDTVFRNWLLVAVFNKRSVYRESGAQRLHYSILLVPAMFLATAIAFGHLGGFVAVVLAFGSFLIKLSEEEKLMRQQFPEQYRSYEQRVKRIIPLVL